MIDISYLTAQQIKSCLSIREHTECSGYNKKESPIDELINALIVYVDGLWEVASLALQVLDTGTKTIFQVSELGKRSTCYLNTDSDILT